jgi:adenylate cyclase
VPLDHTQPAAATFIFADIAGFTAITEAHGDEHAARLVADFSAAVDTKLAAFGATQIKTIGDALMLRVADPPHAVRLGLTIAQDVLTGHGAPSVRVDMHHGPAIERNADYIGATVNLAARISGTVSGGEVLLTAETAALAPLIDGVLHESRGRQALRNVRDPVELVAAVRHGHTSQSGLAIDPACHMAVDPERAAARLNDNGSAYFFCTLACAGEFARHPERFMS